MGEIARSIELYNSAFRLAWQRIPKHQQEQTNIARRLHDAIRRQINEGATLDVLIASKALDELAECRTGLPKQRDAPNKMWIKVKNPKANADA